MQGLIVLRGKLDQSTLQNIYSSTSSEAVAMVQWTVFLFVQ
uniref:Uncharacterized protein n=1 Tax=Anguilla anguilla TaxID=7936 RepID=A0A0E9PE91_ANGAN